MLKEINHDISSDRRMFRIIQGDVGSGKTIVSLLSIVNVIDGYQCALMSPTEILARQHYELAKELFKNININLEFITEKLNLGKKEIQKNLENGKVNLIIGTHALFQKLILKNLV